MTEENYVPSIDDLEALFVNNAQLEAIETHVTKFNPIKVMRIEHMEIRHSSILAWLLDPQESHGLSDKFLKAFLGEALRGASALGYPTALDISQSDLRDTIVRREWQNIDIFLHNPKNKWAFVVENKFHSTQSDGQLSRYIEKVHSLLNCTENDLSVRGIFLTLYEEDAQDERYVPIGYDAICEFLPRFIDLESHMISNEVTIFLRHYLEILREAVGESEEHSKMVRIAQQLYRDHRKVLEFVMEHGETTSFDFAVQLLIGEEPNLSKPITIDKHQYVFEDTCDDWIGFRPISWVKALGGVDFKWDGSESSWADGPVMAWLAMQKDPNGSRGTLKVHAEIGPIANRKFKAELISTIQAAAVEHNSKLIKFHGNPHGENRRWIKFFKDTGQVIDDVQNADEIAEAMKTSLRRMQSAFEIIGELLPQFKKYGE